MHQTVSNIDKFDIVSTYTDKDKELILLKCKECGTEFTRYLDGLKALPGAKVTITCKYCNRDDRMQKYNELALRLYPDGSISVHDYICDNGRTYLIVKMGKFFYKQDLYSFRDGHVPKKLYIPHH